MKEFRQSTYSLLYMIKRKEYLRDVILFYIPRKIFHVRANDRSTKKIYCICLYIVYSMCSIIDTFPIPWKIVMNTRHVLDDDIEPW